MTSRNRRTRAFALLPTAALSAAAIAVVAQEQGVAPTGASSTAASLGTAPAVPTSPTTVLPPLQPSTSAPAAAGAQEQPASATRAGSLLAGNGALARAAITARRDALTSASTVPAGVIAPTALAAYQRAAAVIDQADSGCHLDWELLAGIGRVESDHGTFGGSRLNEAGIATPAIYGPALNGRHHTERVPDTDGGRLDGSTKFDRAVGPMQILPSTWMLIAVDGDGDGRRDPQDINDAALASAVYLCSTGDDLAGQDTQRSALLRYNHSAAYATEVLALASSYQTTDGTGATDGGVLPAVDLLPPLSAGGLDAGTPDATGAAASTPTGSHRHHHKGAPKHTKKHHATKKHGHHGSASTSKAGDAPTSAPTAGTTAGPTSGPTSGPTAGTTSSPTSGPGKPSPTGGASGSPTPVATDAQLADLCRTAILKAYPEATATAVDNAVTSCTKQLSGLTLDQAKSKLDDLLAKLPDSVSDLGPESTDEPSGSPSGSPSPGASGSTPDTPADGPTAASTSAG